MKPYPSAGANVCTADCCTNTNRKEVTRQQLLPVVPCDAADTDLLSQSHLQLLSSLDIGVGEALGQLSQLLLPGRRRCRWQRWRLPAIPKLQRAGRKVMILRPLQPAHTHHHMTTFRRSEYFCHERWHMFSMLAC